MINKVRTWVVSRVHRRVFWSFAVLVFLFVVNGIITIGTINRTKQLSFRLSRVVDPSLQMLDDFKKMMLESKMYTTNWVFLRSKQEDKDLLKKLHETEYEKLKVKIIGYAAQWEARNWADSMNTVFNGFEELLGIEKGIMKSLNDFSDYDDPVIKLGAERLVEEEVLPRSSALMNSLNAVYKAGVDVRVEENNKLIQSSQNLRYIIIIMAIVIIVAGLLLSTYLTKTITGPINQIRLLINDLGRGIVNRKKQETRTDEIGEMIRSVNNLSENLAATIAFAHEVGDRNFDSIYEPLSQDDKLGKALIAMRNNLRKNEENLQLHNKEMERKNKELEQFAYVASHDLQEPLRTISSFVDLLKNKYYGKLEGDADKYMTYISQSSDRMKVLIHDLLEYSRIGNKKQLQIVDCNTVAQEVLADLNKTITDQHASIRVKDLPVISGYRTEFKQLLQNLVVNAIKFRKKETLPEVTISASQAENRWDFAIRDNGIGIAKEHQERIFNIFQRLHTRSEYEGSGIGLAHCKKIVGLHGGKIWINSTLEKGTTFHFTIPIIPF